MDIIEHDIGIENKQTKPNVEYIERLGILKNSKGRDKKYAWFDTGRLMSREDYLENYMPHDKNISYNSEKLLSTCNNVMRYGGGLIVQMLESDMCMVSIVHENEHGTQRKIFQKKSVGECEDLLYKSIEEFI